MVRSATEHYFGGGLGILLGRCRLPRAAVEPVGRRGQALCSEETPTELFMLRAREFDMMGELVDQPAAQVRSRPGDSNHHGRRARPVLGAVIELPRGTEGDREDASAARLVGREKTLPDLGGEGVKIVRNGVIESKRWRVIWASDQQSPDDHRRRECENEDTTHPRSLLNLGAADRSEFSGQCWNQPRSVGDAVTKEEQV